MDGNLFHGLGSRIVGVIVSVIVSTILIDMGLGRIPAGILGDSAGKITETALDEKAEADRANERMQLEQMQQDVGRRQKDLEERQESMNQSLLEAQRQNDSLRAISEKISSAKAKTSNPESVGSPPALNQSTSNPSYMAGKNSNINSVTISNNSNSSSVSNTRSISTNYGSSVANYANIYMNSELKTTINRNIRLEPRVVFTNYGSINGDVIIERGATLRNYGVVRGRIYNQGGYIETRQVGNPVVHYMQQPHVSQPAPPMQRNTRAAPQYRTRTSPYGGNAYYRGR